MKGFHGLLCEWTTLLVVLSIFANTLPHNAYADDLKDADQLNDSQTAEKVIEFQGKKTFYGNLSDAVGKTWDAGSYYPVIISAGIATATVYYHRQYGLSAYLDDVQRIWRNWRAKPESIAALREFRGGTIETELTAIIEKRKAAATEMKGLIQGASRTEAIEVYKQLPADVTGDLKGVLPKKGVAGTVSLEQLLAGANKLNELNGAEYGLWKKLSAAYRKHIGMSPLRFDHRFVNPDDYMIQAHEVASKTHNPRVMERELRALATAVEKEVGVSIGPLSTARPVWWKRTWSVMTKVVGVGFLTQTKLGGAIMSVLGKSFKLAWPALLIVGPAMLAMTYVHYSQIVADEKRRESEFLDGLKRKRHWDHQKYSFELAKDSLLLSAELAWQDIRDRYPDEPFAKQDSHFKPGDIDGREWVDQAWRDAGIAVFNASENPYERGADDDKAADKLIEELAAKLNIEVPEKANRLSTKFYQIFWLELLAKATAMPGGEALKNMPDSRNLSVERQGFAERPPITKQELAHDLAVSTPYALFLASHLIREERAANDLWIKLEPEKLEKIMKILDEVEPNLAKRYREVIALRKAKKESSERAEKDLLPLDPEDQQPAPAPAPADPANPANPMPAPAAAAPMPDPTAPAAPPVAPPMEKKAD